MIKIKRSEFAFFYFRNGQVIDLDALFEGEFKECDTEVILAFPILHGEEIVILQEELKILTSIPTSKWQYIDIESSLIEKFAKVGLVLIDNINSKYYEFVKKESILNKSKWNIYAAFFHFFTKWNNINVEMVTADYEGDINLALYNEGIENILQKNGVPPTHFHKTNSLKSYKLPINDITEDPYYQVILKRRTSRLFDNTRPVKLHTLSNLLLYTFGCHGKFEMNKQLVLLHKTVPSGGSLHPTEAYILCLNVDSLEPGIYHYNVEEHSLDLTKSYSQKEAEEFSGKFVAGQFFVNKSSFLILMTSRFFRNFWKYQQHTLAYKVVLLDAGHLSQMFYLNAVKEGLGCFVTGAINASLIEQELNIDGFNEGALLIVGCGNLVDLKVSNLLEPNFTNHDFKR